MTTREFIDSDGVSWYVSEGANGQDRYLRFDAADESRCAFRYPQAWAESSAGDLAALFKEAIVTWRRGER